MLIYLYIAVKINFLQIFQHNFWEDLNLYTGYNVYQDYKQWIRK